MNNLNFFKYFQERNNRQTNNNVSCETCNSLDIGRTDFKKYFSFKISKKNRRELTKEKLEEHNTTNDIQFHQKHNNRKNNSNTLLVNDKFVECTEHYKSNTSDVRKIGKTHPASPLSESKQNNQVYTLKENVNFDKSKTIPNEKEAEKDLWNKTEANDTSTIGTKLMKVKEMKQKKGKLYKIFFQKKNTGKNEKREDGVNPNQETKIDKENNAVSIFMNQNKNETSMHTPMTQKITKQKRIFNNSQKLNQQKYTHPKNFYSNNVKTEMKTTYQNLEGFNKLTFSENHKLVLYRKSMSDDGGKISTTDENINWNESIKPSKYMKKIYKMNNNNNNNNYYGMSRPYFHTPNKKNNTEDFSEDAIMSTHSNTKGTNDYKNGNRQYMKKNKGNNKVNYWNYWNFRYNPKKHLLNKKKYMENHTNNVDIGNLENKNNQWNVERNDYISRIRKERNLLMEHNGFFHKNEPVHYKDNVANYVLNWNTNLSLQNESYFKNKNEHKHRRSISLTNEKEKLGPQFFIFLKVIGKGSYGKVVLVKHAKEGKLYAMKILRKENIISRNHLEHTKIERHVLKRVSHPFIVKLYFAFQTSKKIYFILEYCPGGELFFHLSKFTEFSEEVVKFYASEVILALQYLHKLNIIYRDLKPENILLDEYGHIRLTDFGLSKEGISDNISAKSLCGTPEYLAPEIISQSGHGRAVDWWSLGILIFEMLTGTLPFNNSNRKILFEKIKTEDLVYPKKISPVAVDLLKKLFQKNPNKRLGSGETDAKEIMDHPFFQNVNWDDLYHKRIKPPFKPVLFTHTDLRNFDNEFLSMPLRHSDQFDSNPHGNQFNSNSNMTSNSLLNDDSKMNSNSSSIFANGNFNIKNFYFARNKET